MSVSASPTSTAALPCRIDPDRWFERTDRAYAVAACLACPARAWCAREALNVNPSWGMGHHYLRAIAQTTTPTSSPPTNIDRNEPPRQAPVVIRPPAKHTVAAVITARSSGHREIMTADCRLDLEAITSRIPAGCRHELPNPAAGYAVCSSCQAAVTKMQPP